MNKAITNEILVSYSQCPRKAYLLLCTNQGGIPNEYISIVQQRKEALQRNYINAFKQKNPDVQPYSLDNLKSGINYLADVTLATECLEAECGLLTKINESSSRSNYSYEPTIFVGTYSIAKEHKLELLFVGHVLNKIQNKLPASGRIIAMDEDSHKVSFGNITKTLIPLIEPLQEWITASSPEPPLLILNRHCVYCQFQKICKDQAEQEDNLSLLDAISTPKAIRKYEKKGIFTVKQLSYTFRPRKRKKRAKSIGTAPKPELQALAIRTGKIYIQELPEISRSQVELFLDIEGIPDQSIYYLIGLLICENETCTHHSFWADIIQDEADIWKRFLEKVNQYPDAPIYHYGSYEPNAIKALAKRYETNSENIGNRLVNINKHIYSKVYFPVKSNGLKEIGNFIGASWSSSDASGLQSLVWRHYWEETQDTRYQDILVTYNEEDCQALKLLTDEISKIKHSANILSDVDFANPSKQYATETGKQIHSQFQAILELSYFNYDKKKIHFRQDEKESNEYRIEKKQKSRKGWYQGQRKVKPKAMKVIQVSQQKTCPIHGSELLRTTNHISKKLIIDLVLTKTGIKKTIIEYEGPQVFCPKCRRRYNPPDIYKYYRGQTFGHGFKSWVVYQRVALRLPYESIIEIIEEHFDERMDASSVPSFIKSLARYYIETEKIIIQKLLKSTFIHADETHISIQGTNWYVWVFANDKYVIFKLRETREAIFVHEFLADYQGILISDFYSGYDSVSCKQQKCWVHLIRDINNDLRENPFDTEYEFFVLELRNLIIPIMEAIQKYGLKKFHLNKFQKFVDRFYENVITDKQYKSDLVLKYQNRFIRYRDSLFTFLDQDGIPWHNNSAERAIRHVAIQRDKSSSLSETVTSDYLLLLGIRQTCRFHDKSFFKFLFSGEKDIDQFMASKRSRRK